MVFVHHLVNQFEANLHLVLLTPLNKPRFEIHLLARHLIEVDILLEDLLLDKLHAAVIAAIQVNRANKGLEGVTVEVTVVRL